MVAGVWHRTDLSVHLKFQPPMDLNLLAGRVKCFPYLVNAIPLLTGINWIQASALYRSQPLYSCDRYQLTPEIHVRTFEQSVDVWLELVSAPLELLFLTVLCAF